MDGSPRKSVTFDAGGEKHALKYSLAALCRIEEAFDKGALEVINMLDGDQLRVSHLRDVFWAGLVGAYTRDDAVKIIDEIGITRAAEYMGKAIVDAFPPAAESEAQPGKRKTTT